MVQDPQNQAAGAARRGIFDLLTLALFVLFLVHFFWDIATERGLIGWVMTLQSSGNGRASMSLAYLVWFVLMIPAYALVGVGAYILLKIDALPATPAPAPAPAPAAAPQVGGRRAAPVASNCSAGPAAAPQVGGRRASVLASPMFIIGAAMLVPGWGGVYASYKWETEAHRYAAVHQTATTPARFNADTAAAGFLRPIRLEAAPLPSETVVFDSTSRNRYGGRSSSRVFFVPLVDGASPGPVRVLLRISHKGELSRYELEQPYVVRSRWQGLPSHIRAAFRRKGVSLARDVAVVERLPGAPPSRLFVLVMGFVVTIISGLMMALGLRFEGPTRQVGP